jgi:hypothetical protein
MTTDENTPAPEPVVRTSIKPKTAHLEWLMAEEELMYTEDYTGDPED